MANKPGGYYPEERATGGWLGNTIVALLVLITMAECILGVI